MIKLALFPLHLMDTVSKVIQEGRAFLENRMDLRTVDIAKKWRVLLTEADIQNIVKNLARRIDKLFAGTDLIIVCLLKGCVYFFVDLTKNMTIPFSTYFIEMSSYKNKQTTDGSESVEILSIINPEKFKGKTVLLLDELYDTGNTLRIAVEEIHNKALLPMDKIWVCTLFKKNKFSANRPPEICGITLPDVWLVGYGLDDQQEKRGWTHLFACPKAPGLELTPDDEIFTSNTAYHSILEDILKQI